MPELRPIEKEGSRRLLERMVTFSALSVSAILRERSESLMASRISPLALRRNRWRLPRLLDLGLSRRSTICICLYLSVLAVAGTGDASTEGAEGLGSARTGWTQSP